MVNKHQYFRQIDGLRAIVVLAVIYHHWFGDLGVEYTQAGHQGAHGVTLFFVLSGFLITDILIKSKDRVAEYGLPKVLKIFYIRRTLRIFPIYYLYIALCLFGIPELRLTVWWYLTYLFNFQLYLSAFNTLTPEGDWMFRALQHTWTLCIEEQFYLFWPLCILLTPKNKIWLVILIMIIFSLGFHFYSQYYLKNAATRHHTFDAMLALLCGAALTLFKNKNLNLPAPSIMLPLFLAAFIVFYFPPLSVSWLGRNFVMAEGRLPILLSVYLVFGAYSGFSGWFGKLLDAKPMVFIGKISYGAYLYHLEIPYQIDYIFELMGWEVNLLLKALIYLIVTLGVCQISWMLIEKPLNNLKDKFTY